MGTLVSRPTPYRAELLYCLSHTRLKPSDQIGKQRTKVTVKKKPPEGGPSSVDCMVSGKTSTAPLYFLEPRILRRTMKPNLSRYVRSGTRGPPTKVDFRAPHFRERGLVTAC